MHALSTLYANNKHTQARAHTHNIPLLLLLKCYSFSTYSRKGSGSSVKEEDVGPQLCKFFENKTIEESLFCYKWLYSIQKAVEKLLVHKILGTRFFL